MKHLIKIAGLCLASALVLGVAITGTAQASWIQCSEGTEKVLPTKYTEHQCLKAAAGNAGRWQWNEVRGTEEVRIKGSLRLKDTKTLAGTSEVECSGESIGDIGPGQFGRIQTVEVSAAQCRAVKVCENVEVIKALNLPWQTELYDTEGKVLQKLTGTISGKEPAWEVECKAPIIGKTNDVCEGVAGEPESLLLTNVETISTNVELLVLASFQHLRKATCSVGGKGAGEVTGSVAILKANGWGLEVA
jgi:hypothetical protein